MTKVCENTDARTAPKERKKERRVVSILGEDYRRLRIFAAEEDITITEAFHRIMESSTVIVR